MDKKISQVAAAMMQCNRGDIKRIEHSLKVYAYACQLGHAESLDSSTLEILEITALLHDIGIHVSERKFGKCTARDQEVEGPPVAAEILKTIGYTPEVIERVCFIISHHHTFTAIDNIDFQILVEADFLVNATEDHATDHQIITFAKNVFKTESGMKCLKVLFPEMEFNV